MSGWNGTELRRDWDRSQTGHISTFNKSDDSRGYPGGGAGFNFHSHRDLETFREIRTELERRGLKFRVDAVCLEFRIHAAVGGGVLICGFNRLKPGLRTLFESRRAHLSACLTEL